MVLMICQEIKPTWIALLRENKTLKQCELENGDIIIVQKTLSVYEYVGF
jgi:ICP0-binding domain of Ubiquitin-specific protease 7